MNRKEAKVKLGLAFDLIIQTSHPLEMKKWSRIVKISKKVENEYRALPFRYQTIVERLKREGFFVNSTILEEIHLSDEYKQALKLNVQLRDYQKETLTRFTLNKYRGVVILPTAAGKTIIGLSALEKIKQKTLIVVPVINLLEQWIKAIVEFTSITREMVGQFGDNVKEIKDITVTTYASARQNINTLRKHFSFIIFDEVHHLPAEKTIKIAEGFPAPYRLGLTATPDRADSGEKELYTLIGPQIVVSTISDLVNEGFVAKFDLETIEIDLFQKEQMQYEKYMNIYRSYLRKRKIQIRSPKDYERYLVFRVNVDPEAKEALEAHRKARTIVYSSQSKLVKIAELLKRHKSDRVLIFSEFNDMVYMISKRFLIPSITHETKSSERNVILKKFKEGKYSKLVTGKVLDEGLDVKEANVGIIVSGSGQSRQFIQRLGRLLRPKTEKVKLYELVTSSSLEVSTAKRRKKSEII
ncbi:MAG: DEAD/DEAH box helicase [Candidatus Heimdallarchaeum aukensis]|uniref:DEAD/DEAH box helicase n=1 Tax=Candidatus Heimdallarchaeum aukensis TaxID=2876573 RepID=A0A9Y1BM80_9ARCH|nr:MAG: DEAD/DEAH box helicase [Candidatus Heimdallarchaeum aukensis]